ncbi:UBP1-associated protein 2A-like [Magnolia sinica]|uniref:UBP1-associated protein 2A-like n=1 Tax=Magnolia sinica TaxID=86752 RepID=UPI002659D64C|nr:UBP1-associated protein 2A-like [Magnolia sinica]XP_058107645.1 UBP1-associated protein 2A-like [Magnolia sinica]XP_058107646.1 UBP1-associated protein 2A-like [Magnolia sinica]XP_058107647.1 UBP1-associated protein 2A-like [Magnolia sinica]
MTKKRKLEPKPEPKPEPEPEPEPEPTPPVKHEEEEEEEHEPTLFDEDDDVDEDEDDAQEEPDHSENPQNAPNSSIAAPPSTVDPDASSSDGEDDEEPVEKLLEPFPKEQLIELLCSAASTHPDVLASIRHAADADPVHRKIFVHGLGWDTDAEALSAVFKKYGEIEDCNAVRDKISGKSKGYGFILFKHRSGARKALREPQKRIGNRMTACQLASTGPVPPAPPPAPPVSEYTQRKIYVSNVSADIDPQRLMQFFAKYGEIEEGPLGLDKQTGKPKGFTLFVYKSVESARKALEDPHKNFEGHILHCQKAIDGPKPNKPHFAHHPHRQSSTPHGSHFPRNENNPNFMGGMGNHGGGAAGAGHMMAPSPAGMPFNTSPAAAAAGINPALGQALTALLATQGAGLGLTNLLGTLGTAGMAAPVNQNVPASMVNNAGHGIQGGYGNQQVGNNVGPNVMGGYGNQPAMQGGYPNPQMGQGNAGRSQQGVGHMGGIPPYMGH